MLGNNRGRDYDVIDTADGKVLVSVRYLTPTEPSDCCMCGRSTFDHFAVPYYCGATRSGKSEGGYAPACQRCYDRWARWDDGLEEYDSWLEVLRTRGVAAVDPLAVIDKAMAERKPPEQPPQGNMSAEFPPKRHALSVMCNCAACRAQFKAEADARGVKEDQRG